MSNFKLFLTCMLLTVLSIGNVWGAAELTGSVVYSCSPISIATSTTYSNYAGTVNKANSTDLTASASWQMTCGSSNGLGSNNNQKAKMILSNGSYSAASAIASAIGKQTNTTYVAAFICNTELSNVGKFAFSHSGYGNNAPGNMWLCYSLDDWKTATAVSLTVGTSGNYTFDATIAKAKYAFVIYKTTYTTVKSPIFTFYEGTSGSTKTTVTYDANGKTLSASSAALPVDANQYAKDADITISTTQLSADGFDFQGWNTDKNAEVGLNSTVKATGSPMTFFAIWKTHICTSTANITKASVMNGSFVVSDESVCIEGGPGSVTITCTPNTNYHVSNVTSTVGSANGNGNNWMVTGITADAEISVVFTEDTYDTYIDNLQDGGEQKKYGSYTAPSLTDKTPATSGTCEQVHYHFVGWVGAENKANPTDSNIIKAAAEQTATGATYYAVWAKEE